MYYQLFEKKKVDMTGKINSQLQDMSINDLDDKLNLEYLQIHAKILKENLFELE